MSVFLQAQLGEVMAQRPHDTESAGSDGDYASQVGDPGLVGSPSEPGREEREGPGQADVDEGVANRPYERRGPRRNPNLPWAIVAGELNPYHVDSKVTSAR